MIDINKIISPGRIVKINKHIIMDQLSGETMKRKEFDNHIFNKYGLTLEEYYNLVVNGDKNYRPKCPCGNNLRFNSGNISNPYKVYCSTQCGNKYREPDILIDNNIFDKLDNNTRDFLLYNRTEVNINGKLYNIFGYGKYVHPDFNKLPNWYIDQIKGIGVYERGFKKYLLSEYNLSEEDYYNIITSGNKENNHKCTYCGKESKFISPNKGYLKYCNTRCQSNHQADLNSHPFQNKELIEYNRERLLNRSHPMLNKESTILKSKNSFISRCMKFNHSSANIYLAVYKNDKRVFKIGITTDEVRTRLSNSKCRNFGEILSIHLLRSGDPITIAELESIIKLNYSIKVHSTEDIDYKNLREVLKLIKNYKYSA